MFASGDVEYNDPSIGIIVSFGGKCILWFSLFLVIEHDDFLTLIFPDTSYGFLISSIHNLPHSYL